MAKVTHQQPEQLANSLISELTSGQSHWRRGWCRKRTRAKEKVTNLNSQKSLTFHYLKFPKQQSLIHGTMNTFEPYSLEQRMQCILGLLLKLQELFFHSYSQDVWASTPWWLDASSCARPHPADPPGWDAGQSHPRTAACTRQCYLKRRSRATGWEKVTRR